MKHLMTYVAAMITLLWGGAAAAQTSNMNTGTKTGTVVSVAGDSIVITADDGQRLSFHRDSLSAVPATLAAGQRVRIEYNEVAGGAYHVTNVSVLPMDGSTTNYDNTDRTATGYRADMPGTASPFPLLALLGVVALGAGLSSRVALRRSR
jgi:hypothetical protein